MRPGTGEARGKGPPRGRTLRTGQPRGAPAYSPMSWICARGMRGGEGDNRSPPVTVS